MDIQSQIKFGLSELLLKQGSSLEELEQALSSKDAESVTTKLAGVLLEKEAFIGEGLNFLSNLGGKAIGEGIPALAALSLATGALGGGTLYAMDPHINNQNKRLDDKENEVDRMRNITNRLKLDYNLQ